MTAIFDTHAAIKRLKSAGFDDGQAEAVSDTVHNAITGGVATKADITELRNEMNSKITEVRIELKDDIGKVREEVAELRGRMNIGIALLVAAIVIPFIRDLAAATP